MFKRLKHSISLCVLALLASCDATIVETDCLEVVAAKVKKDGWMVTISSVSIRVKDDCQKVKAASYKSYREKNGVPGYQLDPSPSDEMVDQKEADLNEETSTLDISNISNHHTNNGVADSWELEITYGDGDTSTFSGNF